MLASPPTLPATEQPATRLCAACFDGNYPIHIPGSAAATLGIDQEDA